MGGALSLACVQHAEDISCGVVCYGLPPAAICDPSRITKPVQGHFGEEDNLAGFSDKASAQKVLCLESLLRSRRGCPVLHGVIDHAREVNAECLTLQMEQALKEAGSLAEFFIYPGVGHAFLNSTPAPHASFEARKEAQGFPPYDETQAEIAWGRIKAFFKDQIMA